VRPTCTLLAVVAAAKLQLGQQHETAVKVTNVMCRPACRSELSSPIADRRAR
jgi:methylphosphotriester-DNA--protein-cysteine methyltransferase